MKFPITYSKKSMTLTFQWGKYYKCLQCPFGTWWKVRKYFKRPKFKFYFGPMWKYKGKKQTKFGEYDDYEYKGGYWPAASTEFLKWYTPKWFPIHVLSWDIGWKDKYDTPRYETPGCFIIFFGRNYYKHWQFSMVVTAPEFFCSNDCTEKDFPDNYWESILWCLHYTDNLDLIKTRNTLNKKCWSTSRKVDITDYEILNIGTEELNVGNNDKKQFKYLDIESEILLDAIYDTEYYPKSSLTSELPIYINIEITDGLKTERSIYCKLINDKIRIYYFDTSDIFKYILNKEYSKLKLSLLKPLNLGPTFKDDFLTNRGIKEVKKFYKM